jgi:hypothetical protein
LSLPGDHILCRGTYFFLSVLSSGVDRDTPLKLPGSYIPHIDIYFLHVLTSGVFCKGSLTLPCDHIPYICIFSPHALTVGVELGYYW